MNVFRSAVGARDSTKEIARKGTDDTEIDSRVLEHREGTSFHRLQDYLLIDLSSLLSTVHLEATEDLSEFPLVRKSILNYGVLDVSRLTSGEALGQKVRDEIKQALLDHEPRLIAETVVVHTRTDQAKSDQSVAYEIEAVMAARPVDVPLEFVAEIDTGSGKVLLSDLSVHE